MIRLGLCPADCMQTGQHTAFSSVSLNSQKPCEHCLQRRRKSVNSWAMGSCHFWMLTASSRQTSRHSWQPVHCRAAMVKRAVSPKSWMLKARWLHTATQAPHRVQRRKSTAGTAGRTLFPCVASQIPIALASRDEAAFPPGERSAAAGRVKRLPRNPRRLEATRKSTVRFFHSVIPIRSKEMPANPRWRQAALKSARRVSSRDASPGRRGQDAQSKCAVSSVRTPARASATTC